MTAQPLFLMPGASPRGTPPADRGPVVDAKDAATRIFDGRVSRKWVLAHAAPTKRFRFGRDVCWYEADLLEWKAEWICSQQQKHAEGM